MLDWLFGAPLPVGSPAPEFAANDEAGNLIALSSLRGSNVVLVFYPGDDTPTCTRQLCEFRDRWQAVQGRNALVFGVNPWSAASKAKFRARYRFPFPLLVDRGGRVARLYRAGGPVIRRTVYLIGPDGTIRYARRGKPDPEEVLSAAG